jgi:hypothetical protein
MNGGAALVIYTPAVLAIDTLKGANIVRVPTRDLRIPTVYKIVDPSSALRI